MTAGEATREFYREQGRKQERERIIKLLEAIKGEEKACCVECQPHLDTHRQYLTVLIDMIKE